MVFDMFANLFADKDTRALVLAVFLDIDDDFDRAEIAGELQMTILPSRHHALGHAIGIYELEAFVRVSHATYSDQFFGRAYVRFFRKSYANCQFLQDRNLKPVLLKQVGVHAKPDYQAFPICPREQIEGILKYLNEASNHQHGHHLLENDKRFFRALICE